MKKMSAENKDEKKASGSMEKILSNPRKEGLLAHYEKIGKYLDNLSELDSIANEFIQALYGEKGLDGKAAAGAVKNYYDKVVAELGKTDEIMKDDPKDGPEYLAIITSEKGNVGEMLNVAVTRILDKKNEYAAGVHGIKANLQLKKAESAKAEAEYKQLEAKLAQLEEAIKGMSISYKEFTKLGESLKF